MQMNEKKRFSLVLKPTLADIDEMGHVNNVVYVRWIQEVAAAHWQAIASDELKRKYSWVVLRHEIDYRAPVFNGELVAGTTWVGDHHGAKFDRFVQLTCNNRVVAEAKTTWCLLDAASLRPLRIPSEVLALL